MASCQAPAPATAIDALVQCAPRRGRTMRSKAASELPPMHRKQPMLHGSKGLPGGIWYPSVMQFYSGPLIHFLSGVDSPGSFV